MINHLRTLLFNSAPGVADPVLVPPYSPPTLPADLRALLAAFYGTGADVQGRLVTVARLLAAVHGSPLAAEAVKYDARVTYDANAPGGGAVAVSRFVVDPATDKLTVVGTPAFVSPGRGYGKWRVAVAFDGLSVQVTDLVTGDLSPVVYVDESAETVGGLTLDGTTAEAVYRLPAVAGAQYDVTLTTQPTQSPADMLSAFRAYGPGLFAESPPEYRTIADDDTQPTGTRLAASALAFADLVEAVRGA